MHESKLYKQITNPINVYNAIYSLESYIFEPHLLSSSDIQDLHRLRDKYDDVFITSYVEKCIATIKEIINGDNLFSCDVFFQAKKHNPSDGKVEFRPIHSASLLDQVCMVVLLSVLMFDDDSGKRRLSAISRLLPASFYGNIPSLNVSELFKPWNKQYKDYSNDALTANRNYFESKRYKYELTLDLKRFFPSVNPAFIYNYILDKWPVNATSNDEKCLHKILEKLLFFNLTTPRKLKDYYYPKGLSNKKNLKLNIGIAQGLPQAYFFGNICMTIIAKHENKLLNGDSYFYVDDSIVYTNEEITQESIDVMVGDINSEVNEYGDIASITNNNLKHFHEQVKKIYKLQIHPLGEKSEFKVIDKVDSLYFLAKPASLFSFEIRTAQDEFEDISLLKKAEALLLTIDFLIKKVSASKEGMASGNASQIELSRLYRFRKFYLNRINYLKLSQSADLVYDKEKINSFIERFQLKLDPKNSDFFNMRDSDVFIFESQMIANQVSNNNELKNIFLSAILDFELSCISASDEDITKYLYYNKVLSTITNLAALPQNKYYSLKYSKLTQGINNRNRLTSELKINNIQAIIDLVK